MPSQTTLASAPGHEPTGISRLVVQYLVEKLDLPALGVPVELFNRFGRRCYRQISDKPPIDRGPPFRCSTLTGMQDGKVERRIALLLADRWQHLDPSIA